MPRTIVADGSIQPAPFQYPHVPQLHQQQPLFQHNLLHQQLQVFHEQFQASQQHKSSESSPTASTISPTTANATTTITTQKTSKVGKIKRVRTIFTPEQLRRLEQEFASQMYLVGGDRGELAKSLNLTEAQVKVWFQNRRIKFRKLSTGPQL